VANDIRSGWDLEAQLRVDREGCSLDTARDDVIMRYLTAGDTRPFSDWVRSGHAPSKWVLCALAEIMEPRPETLAVLPFALVRKKRGGGKKNSRPDPEIDARDSAIALNVKARIDGGLKYDAAIAEVREFMGGRVDEKTVRNAYDSRHGSGARRV
jgi:hypothetical protein